MQHRERIKEVLRHENAIDRECEKSLDKGLSREDVAGNLTAALAEISKGQE